MTKNTPWGFGMFIWYIKTLYNYGGRYMLPGQPFKDHSELAASLKNDFKMDWIMLKVVSSIWKWNYRRNENGVYVDDYIEPFIAAMRSEGIKVWGWGDINLNSPSREAQVVIERVRQFNLDGWVTNAEEACKNKYNQAKAYASILRQGLPGTHLSLSTYRFPHVHPTFPLKAFWGYTDSMMPQVYWMNAHNPTQQLENTLKAYREFAAGQGLSQLPIYPTGAAFKEHAWIVSEVEMLAFTQACVDNNIPALSWWELWQSYRAGRDQALLKCGQLWRSEVGDVVTDPIDPPVELTIEEKVEKLWSLHAGELRNE